MTKDELYQRTIRDLLDAMEGHDIDDPVSDPEGYAAMYWGRAVLNPKQHMADHPVVADQLQVLIGQPA